MCAMNLFGNGRYGRDCNASLTKETLCFLWNVFLSTSHATVRLRASLNTKVYLTKTNLPFTT